MKRRGVSEIISAIIVISIVVAGLGIYVSLSQQRILADTVTVKESINMRDDQISELIEFVEMFRNNTNPNTIEIVLHNYGLKNVTISNIYVNGTQDLNAESIPYHVRDLKGVIISPNNKTIPVDKTSELFLDFSTKPPITNGITSLVIKTDSNKLIQFVNNTN
ncbi:MAG: archaellin/type IV pilin N-terminal domain-containing protein [Nitrosarchaeum sp.]